MRWEPGQLGFEKFKRQSRRCGPSFAIITPTPNVHWLSLILTFLHPVLKVSFMKKAKYSDDNITNYKREREQRYHRSYDSSVPVIIPSIPCGKCPRPRSSDSESSDGEDINELTNYLATKRDKSVKDPLAWWFNCSPFSRNCQRWLEMYRLFLQLGQESKESSVYREE